MPRQIRKRRVADYSLEHTLESGQVFRWWRTGPGAWEGVLGGQLVRLEQVGEEITVEAEDMAAVDRCFQWDVDLRRVVATFPPDPLLQAAVRACWGLRILRQEPWECLASFLASSAKQIVQIRQIVESLSRKLGAPLPGSSRCRFPSVEAVAASTLGTLRRCKLGFRAEYLLASARMISEGKVNLERVAGMSGAEGRLYLQQLPGVGDKIAQCVLLFAYGKPEAFPVDVWVGRALREAYFREQRTVTAKRLREFSANHFGPQAGYAQQYLFHFMRTGGRHVS